jgi:hypothetical protein
VTNAIVTERDFWGGTPSSIRRVLRAFPVSETIAFFREIGVSLHEEAGGKLFPDTNRARDVLDSLLRECKAAGAQLAAGHRVLDVEPTSGGFRIVTDRGSLHASAVVLATGGQSLPKSGSDGAGFAMARRLGHTIVPTTPALAPLLLDATDSVHGSVSGVSQDVELAVWRDGAVAVRLAGSALDPFRDQRSRGAERVASWLRARLDGAPSQSRELPPRRPLRRRGRRLAAACAREPEILSADRAVGDPSGIGRRGDPSSARARRDRHARAFPAERTSPAGAEPSSSSRCRSRTRAGIRSPRRPRAASRSRKSTRGRRVGVRGGAFCVGEILDVDGRIGGFNFQWAWLPGLVAGLSIAPI